MRYLLLLCVLTAIAITVVLQIERNRPSYLTALNEERRLQQRVKELQAQTEQLKEELRLLKQDTFYLEKYAREKFGYAASNELVFKFDQ